jgi:hypothetical protein
VAIKNEFDLKSGEAENLMGLQVHHDGVEKAKYVVPCNYFGHTYSVTYPLLPFSVAIVWNLELEGIVSPLTRLT